MSKKENLFEKIKSGPKKVKINQLVKVMEYYNFTTHKSAEGYFFTHDLLKDITIITVPKPHKKHGETSVKKPYVDKCIKAIEIMNELEKQEDQK